MGVPEFGEIYLSTSIKTFPKVKCFGLELFRVNSDKLSKGPVSCFVEDIPLPTLDSRI